MKLLKQNMKKVYNKNYENNAMQSQHSGIIYT